MQNVQFHANSHTNKQAPQPPTPTFLFPGGISLIVKLSKINQCLFHFNDICVLILTKITGKVICFDGKHLHRKQQCGTWWRD